MAPWQDGLTSNKERLSYLYKTGEMCVVTFIVGRDGETRKRFKLHKFVLSMHSDVFFTMFYGSLPEKIQVEVTDINAVIFEIAMRYVYEDTFSVKTMQEAMGIYYVGEKYNIAHLRILCETFIAEHVSPENIPILYRMPNVLKALKLNSKCGDILSKQTSLVLKGKYFVKSPSNLVKNMLQLDNLSIESEAELFQSVLKWAKAARSTTRASENLRSIMDPFLQHIRFLAMNVEEFVSGPARSGVLTDSEKASILENLVEPGRRELPFWCNKNTSRIAFHSVKIVHDHTCRVRGDEQCESRYSYAQSFDQNYTTDIVLKKGTLNFRGVSFYVVASGTGKPKASLSVERRKPQIGSLYVGVKGTTSDQNTSSYEPNTNLMKCMLLMPFTVNRCWESLRVSLSLQHCYFKYCSCRYGKVIFTGNEQFQLNPYFPQSSCEFQLYLCSSPSSCQLYFNEIYYN